MGYIFHGVAKSRTSRTSRTRPSLSLSFLFGFTETFYFKLIFCLFVFNLIYLFPGVYSLTLHSPAQACNVTYLALACHITELSKRPDQNLLWPCK